MKFERPDTYITFCGERPVDKNDPAGAASAIELTLPTGFSEKAHETGLYTIVSTNAQALTPEIAHDLVDAGLSRIIVSMDGLTQTSYNAYRVGGSLEKEFFSSRPRKGDVPKIPADFRGPGLHFGAGVL